MAVGTMVPVRDVVEAAPDIYKSLFENDRVRVLEIRMKPGQESPVRYHPSMVIYALAHSKVRFDYADGTSAVLDMQPNQVWWMEENTQVVHNLLDTEAHVINVELKD